METTCSLLRGVAGSTRAVHFNAGARSEIVRPQCFANRVPRVSEDRTQLFEMRGKQIRRNLLRFGVPVKNVKLAWLTD